MRSMQHHENVRRYYNSWIAEVFDMAEYDDEKKAISLRDNSAQTQLQNWLLSWKQSTETGREDAFFHVV